MIYAIIESLVWLSNRSNNLHELAFRKWNRELWTSFFYEIYSSKWINVKSRVSSEHRWFWSLKITRWRFTKMSKLVKICFFFCLIFNRYKKIVYLPSCLIRCQKNGQKGVGIWSSVQMCKKHAKKIPIMSHLNTQRALVSFHWRHFSWNNSVKKLKNKISSNTRSFQFCWYWFVWIQSLCRISDLEELIS